MRRLRQSLGAFALSTLLAPLAAAAGPVGGCGDGDCVPDLLDNCVAIPNAAPFDCDSDSDGYGNMCDCDYNNDFICGGPDVGAFGGDFGGPESPNYGTDQNCDGIVGGPDFGLFAAGFGGSPGPSGKPCAGNHPGGLGVVGSCP